MTMNLAKEKPSWGATKTFCSLGTGTKSLKTKQRIKSMTTKNSKTKLRENYIKIEINKILTSTVTREKAMR